MGPKLLFPLRSTPDTIGSNINRHITHSQHTYFQDKENSKYIFFKIAQTDMGRLYTTFTWIFVRNERGLSVPLFLFHL